VVRRVTLDAGLVTAVAAGEPRARALLEVFRRHDVEIVVPAPVVTQATTGAPRSDGRVDVVIAGCRVMDTTEGIARRAATLRHSAGLPGATVDAIVVATAELAGGRLLLTNDPNGCAPLVKSSAVRLETP
jgi:predicted nucleic acid-binding protein